MGESKDRLTLLSWPETMQGIAMEASTPSLPSKYHTGARCRWTLPIAAHRLITSKGQVTIPQGLDVRQFGLQGSACVRVRGITSSCALEAEQPLPESGFGLLRRGPP